MPDKRITGLITKKLEGVTLSPEETAILGHWLDQSPGSRTWYAHMLDRRNLLRKMTWYRRAVARKASARRRLEEALEQDPPFGGQGFGKTRSFRLMLRGMAAATLLAVGVGYWQYSQHRQDHPIVAKFTSGRDLPPGGNRAVLTLANGQTIVLDSAGTGLLTRQSGIKVLKLDSGAIAYRQDGCSDQEAQYNTITTPRGGQFNILLADGSRIWLNAASSLRYPVGFTGKSRTVTLLSGEAYFEVVHQEARPFRVCVPSTHPGDKDLEVDVLGTRFDLNAYTDEPAAKATLLSGAVKVIKGTATLTLHPGQQAVSPAGSGETLTLGKDIDTESIVSWKDGLFVFDRAGTETVMRQLARWYDVDVRYEGHVSEHQFVGTIPRDMSASEVLKALEMQNVHFRIEGKTIIVTP